MQGTKQEFKAVIIQNVNLALITYFHLYTFVSFAFTELKRIKEYKWKEMFLLNSVENLQTHTQFPPGLDKIVSVVWWKVQWLWGMKPKFKYFSCYPCNLLNCSFLKCKTYFTCRTYFTYFCIFLRCLEWNRKYYLLELNYAFNWVIFWRKSMKEEWNSTPLQTATCHWSCWQ